MQGCRDALESRIVLFGSVTGGIGIVFGVLEVSFFLQLELSRTHTTHTFHATACCRSQYYDLMSITYADLQSIVYYYDYFEGGGVADRHDH